MDEKTAGFFEKKLAKSGRAWYTNGGFAVKAAEDQLKRKEVNKSNEGRYPSQLSADYD